MVAPLVILGCGYVGTRIAKAAAAAGRPVRVCARGTARMQPLTALGVEVKFLDATTPKQFTTVCASNAGGTVIYSIPPVTALPPGHALRAALQAAYGGGATCFILFSSSGLYGDEPDDDVWVDEDTPIRPDHAMQNIQTDEVEMERCTFDRMKLVTLRLAPVYGPGRGVRNRIRKGDYRILDEGQHVTSRIHVDDVVRIVAAAEEKAPHRSVFLLGDDAPTTQGEYAKWLAERMKVAMPPYRQMFEPGKAKVAHRNRRIRNTRVKETLGIELLYPSFREGEAAIEAEEGAA
ncbi:MAG TPA: NAD-dependent epimerase/dehydratase family protein [Kofleriaceae bacterium]|nr:NAD-dependent epimerase/dehydratase family protein [Kofleriaceae bacterium]